MDGITTGLLWDIFKHVRSWLSNLNRAGDSRKQQSVLALRGVITAARETAVYLRQVRDTGRHNHKTEARLSILWTDLGFALEDLGISKLAKRCQIKGKQWSDPEHYDADFIGKADISLERMEQLAREILHMVNDR
jgi:hypothetical protein